jgi:hypothetical protein
MIDTLSLALTHGLLLLIAWRLFSRDDLDDETGNAGKPKPKPRRWGR